MVSVGQVRSLPHHAFFRMPPPTGQWGARRSTGGFNTRHDIFAPWAGINEDLLYAHALAIDHTWYGMDRYWLEWP